MTIRTLITIAGAGLGLAMLVWTFAFTGESAHGEKTAATTTRAESVPTLAPQPSRSKAEEEGISSRIDVLEQKVEALRAELADMHARLARHRDETQPAFMTPDTEDAQSTADAAQEEAAEVEEERTLATERMQRLGARLQAEAVDGDWATDANTTIREALMSEELTGSVVRAVECRVSLCRLEVAHSSTRERSAFERSLPFKVSPLLPSVLMHTEEHGDGSSRTVVFLFRAEHPLPELSEN